LKIISRLVSLRTAKEPKNDEIQPTSSKRSRVFNAEQVDFDTKKEEPEVRLVRIENVFQYKSTDEIHV
jgi:hypothetical protein